MIYSNGGNGKKLSLKYIIVMAHRLLFNRNQRSFFIIIVWNYTVCEWFYWGFESLLDWNIFNRFSFIASQYFTIKCIVNKLWFGSGHSMTILYVTWQVLMGSWLKSCLKHLRFPLPYLTKRSWATGDQCRKQVEVLGIRPMTATFLEWLPNVHPGLGAELAEYLMVSYMLWVVYQERSLILVCGWREQWRM